MKDTCDEDKKLVVMTGYDDCILGIARGFNTPDVVAYSYEAVIKRNMQDGMTEEEAVEYFEYNQAGAYMGDRTPVFIYPFG